MRAQVNFKMTAFMPTTYASQLLVYYIIFGLIILFNLAMILLIQGGYQVKLGDTVILGKPKPRRVIVTLLGYEVSIGDYDGNGG